MKTRTVFYVYYNSPEANESDDAVLIGRGLDKASAWADAEETAGEPIEDLEPYCYEELEEQTYDEDAHGWYAADGRAIHYHL